ncbi:uncharacterized protein LOC121390657 isoform X1 [Gigantopelta aegis]|uniref:uncharacterized protein LOC121390657 isoform X1 n=1 Tax=Gigantopelta aegis TaxID=1735272 RepID=UPI001B88A011|nr:uncharacterized protein LOC121390657 isoform X1 [Gigantopelta aegis]
MNGPSLIFFSLLCLYLYTPESDSLWCYQCASVKEGQDCQSDYKGMNKSALTMEGKYAKDCSKQFVGQDDSTYKCVIETHMKEGGYFLSFRRDCSDGVHFSYNIEPSTPNISHLQNLIPNNQSACAIYREVVICLTLCDDDFDWSSVCPIPNSVRDCHRRNCGKFLNGAIALVFVACVSFTLTFKRHTIVKTRNILTDIRSYCYTVVNNNNNDDGKEAIVLFNDFTVIWRQTYGYGPHRY